MPGARKVAWTLGALAATSSAHVALADGGSTGPASTARPSDGPPATHAPLPADALVRPPPFKDDIETASLPRTRHLEIGLAATAISVPAADTIAFGSPARTTYSPTVGLEIGLRFPIFRYLYAGINVYGAQHHIGFSQGALGIDGAIQSGSLTTIWFTGRAMPCLPIGDQVRLFGIAGVGWGRFEFPQMTAQESGRMPFIIKGRGSSFVTFPLGFASSIELLKNWLSLDFELDWSPNIHKDDGTSFQIVQAIDNGYERNVGPMPIVHVTYTQSLGLSLTL